MCFYRSQVAVVKIFKIAQVDVFRVNTVCLWLDELLTVKMKLYCRIPEQESKLEGQVWIYVHTVKLECESFSHELIHVSLSG